jgi:hypothetical protein
MPLWCLVIPIPSLLYRFQPPIPGLSDGVRLPRASAAKRGDWLVRIPASRLLSIALGPPLDLACGSQLAHIISDCHDFGDLSLTDMMIGASSFMRRSLRKLCILAKHQLARVHGRTTFCRNSKFQTSARIELLAGEFCAEQFH